jgi:acetyl-CoA C-acetyltransferase
MESIKDKVAIIGMGCIKFGELWDKDPYDMMVDACYEAIEDAGIEPEDIQQGWFASLVSGFTGARLCTALKLESIPVTRVENFCSGGTHALANACYAVAAGVCDIALACGVEKLKDRSAGFAYNVPEPFDSSKAKGEFQPVNMFSQLAMRIFHQNKWAYEEGKRILAQIAVKNHHNGSLNPKAHFQREVTVEEVLNAPIIAYPLGLLDCCPVSDGSAAAIVTRADIAKNFRDDYILVKGLGFANGANQALLQDDFDFTHQDENILAAKRAYEQAGIKDPRNEIDVAVIHDCFTIHEFELYNELGLSKSWKQAQEDVENGTFTLGGKLPVNTDGGLKCFGHPISASGLRMAYEIYKQLQGKAESRQVKNAYIGLTHNAGGIVGAFNSAVAIFGQRD